MTYYHPVLYFNETPVKTAPFQKHLGLILDEKHTFGHHLNEKISKANKGIGLIKRLYSYLPRKSLLVIYKSFIRPLLDYGDVIYDQSHNDTLSRPIESVQYNAALEINGAIKGSSRERLYQELGLESFRDRRWYRRLVYFFNIVSLNLPGYLRSLLPSKQRSHDPRRNNMFRNFSVRTEYFKTPFPHTVNFSHLTEHKFQHNFLDTLNPLCSCSLEIESTCHYLLRCPFYTYLRRALTENITEIIVTIADLSEDKLVKLFLYGDEENSIEVNACILKNTISFLKSSKRFDIPLH